MCGFRVLVPEISLQKKIYTRVRNISLNKHCNRCFCFGNIVSLSLSHLSLYRQHVQYEQFPATELRGCNLLWLQKHRDFSQKAILCSPSQTLLHKTKRMSSQEYKRLGKGSLNPSSFFPLSLSNSFLPVLDFELSSLRWNLSPRQKEAGMPFDLQHLRGFCLPFLFFFVWMTKVLSRKSKSSRFLSRILQRDLFSRK